ncbi:MAG: hypothetical protein Q8P20_01145 [bacterium]|nr:hypothetical protein [bacterium]
MISKPVLRFKLIELINDIEYIKTIIETKTKHSKPMSLIKLAQCKNELLLILAHLTDFVVCDRCNKKVSSNNLVFDPNSSDIICKDCVDF